MHAIDALDMVAFQDAGFAEQPSPAGVFLAGLKDEQNIVGQLMIKIAQAESQSQQHGHMAVIAAGMHLSLAAAAVRPTALMCDPPGIHVAAESEGGRVAIAKKTGQPSTKGEGTLRGPRCARG